MPIKFGMVMDPIDRINIKKDTSFAMLLEAQARGWELHYMELGSLYLRNGKAYAKTRTLVVQCDEKQWFNFAAEQDIALDSLDVIIMRKDPPFDQEYLYATYILELAESAGVYVSTNRNPCVMRMKSCLRRGFRSAALKLWSPEMQAGLKVFCTNWVKLLSSP